MDENEDGEIDYEDFLNLRCFCMEKLTCDVLHLEGVHGMDLQQAWNVSNLPTRFVSLVSHMSSVVPWVHIFPMFIASTIATVVSKFPPVTMSMWVTSGQNWTKEEEKVMNHWRSSWQICSTI